MRDMHRSETITPFSRFVEIAGKFQISILSYSECFFQPECSSSHFPCHRYHGRNRD